MIKNMAIISQRSAVVMSNWNRGIVFDIFSTPDYDLKEGLLRDEK